MPSHDQISLALLGTRHSRAEIDAPYLPSDRRWQSRIRSPAATPRTAMARRSTSTSHPGGSAARPPGTGVPGTLGWRYYDWTKGGDRAWTDVWQRRNGFAVVGAILA
jgi:hypothetical protein